MPKMDGIEATEKIMEVIKQYSSQAGNKDRSEECHIVALTSQTDKETEQRCFKVGMKAIYYKPLSKP